MQVQSARLDTYSGQQSAFEFFNHMIVHYDERGRILIPSWTSIQIRKSVYLKMSAYSTQHKRWIGQTEKSGQEKGRSERIQNLALGSLLLENNRESNDDGISETIFER